MTQAILPAETAATFVLGIDWDFVGYQESSKVWEASTGCDPGHWYTLGYVGNAWNDRIESAMTQRQAIQVTPTTPSSAHSPTRRIAHMT